MNKMDKKFVGNLIFQGGCVVGVLYSCFSMGHTALGLVFLALQIGTSLMHWED